MTPLLDLYISVDNSTDVGRMAFALASFQRLWGNDLHVFCDSLNNLNNLDEFLSVINSLDISTTSFMEGILSKNFEYLNETILNKLSKSRTHALCILINEDLIKEPAYKLYLSEIRRCGLRLEVFYRVDAQNKENLRPILDFCIQEKIKLCVVDIDKTAPHRLFREEYRSFVEDVQQINNEKKIRVSLAECPYLHIYNPSKINAMGGCSGGLISCMIKSDGAVVPCMYLQGVILGNINETPLEEIWNTNELLIKLRNRDNLKGKCGACVYKKICGGCRAESVLAQKDIFDEDRNCCWI